MSKIVRYWRDDHYVAVKDIFKGQHQTMSLCHDCAKFKPYEEGQCVIAATLYSICHLKGGTAIRSECADYAAKH